MLMVRFDGGIWLADGQRGRGMDGWMKIKNGEVL